MNKRIRRLSRYLAISPAIPIVLRTESKVPWRVTMRDQWTHSRRSKRRHLYARAKRSRELDKGQTILSLSHLNTPQSDIDRRRAASPVGNPRRADASKLCFPSNGAILRTRRRLVRTAGRLIKYAAAVLRARSPTCDRLCLGHSETVDARRSAKSAPSAGD
jgi:hypothetical protein